MYSIIYVNIPRLVAEPPVLYKKVAEVPGQPVQPDLP
jgi:hypothetical protein